MDFIGLYLDAFSGSAFWVLILMSHVPWQFGPFTRMNSEWVVKLVGFGPKEHIIHGLTTVSTGAQGESWCEPERLFFELFFHKLSFGWI